MSDIAKSLFGVHGAALSLRQDRLQLLAGNIANADTPGFKAQDMDFGAALRAAVAPAEAAASPGLMRATSALHLGGNDPGGQSFQIARTPLQPSLDGNTVDAQMEHAAFGQAALEYRASLSFVEARVRSMLTAITGQ
jgi:flagellar basal-body rod protein FlgB